MCMLHPLPLLLREHCAKMLRCSVDGIPHLGSTLLSLVLLC